MCKFVVYLVILMLVLGFTTTDVWSEEQRVKATLVSDFSEQSIGGGSFELDILSWVSEMGPTKIDFTRQHVSLNKAITLLSVIPNACVLNVIKTPEREKIGIYGTHPLTVYPPIRLITLAKRNIQLPEPFDLYRLSDLHPWVVGIVKSRHYGRRVDDFIGRHGNILYQRPYSSSIKRFMDMLESGRIDGILEFTRSVEEYLQTSKSPDIQLKVTSLIQANDVVFGYLACAKTPQGQKVIAAVDAAYQSKALKRRIINIHLNYFGEKEKPLLSPVLERVFE